MLFGKSKNPDGTEPDLEIFTIYDSKINAYRDPMSATTRGDMIRSIEKLFRDPSQIQNTLVTNSEDFSLFKVGEYTNKTGKITPTNAEHIINLHEIRALASSKLDRQIEQVGINPT